jgi:hypothetical protein
MRGRYLILLSAGCNAQERPSNIAGRFRPCAGQIHRQHFFEHPVLCGISSNSICNARSARSGQSATSSIPLRNTGRFTAREISSRSVYSVRAEPAARCQPANCVAQPWRR